MSMSWCILGALVAVASAVELIPGEYGVFLKRDVPFNAVSPMLGKSTVLYQGLSGRMLFLHLAQMSPGVAAALAASPLVEVVEQSHVVSLDMAETEEVDELHGSVNSNGQAVCTSNPQNGNMRNWHLLRTSNRHLPNWSTDTHSFRDTGMNTDVYILDTGIDIEHEEFDWDFDRSRAHHSFKATSSWGFDDVNGHGTHCAGLVGGRLLGVAKDAQLFNVKVLSDAGSGGSAGVVQGIIHAHQRSLEHPARRAIVSMSLSGGSPYNPQQIAIQNAIADHVFFMVAAGNQASDAGRRWPSGWPETISVASTTRTDAWSSFSNHGPVVDIAAPGSTIWAAGATRSSSCRNQAPKQCIVSKSGTSMATPIVAGVGAQIVSAMSDDDFETFYQDEMRAELRRTATEDALSGVRANTDNLLLYRNDC